MTSAYERATKRTPSVQTLRVEEGRLVLRLTEDLRNAIDLYHAAAILSPRGTKSFVFARPASPE